MERDTIQRVWAVAEHLCSTGKSLGAVLALCYLLGTGSRQASGASAVMDPAALSRVAFPPYLRLEELATRVRAAECLLLEDTASVAWGSLTPSPQPQSPCPVSRLANAERLELAHLILSPVVAVPLPGPASPFPTVLHDDMPAGSDAATLTTPRMQPRAVDPFFDIGSIIGLTWSSEPFTLMLGNGVGGLHGSHDREGLLRLGPARMSGSLQMPVALVIRACTLQAKVERRRQHFRRAAQCLSVGERWLRAVFDRPSTLRRSMRSLQQDLAARLIHGSPGDEDSGCRGGEGVGDAGATRECSWVHPALESLLHGLLRHERACCEATLAVERCHVLHHSMASCERSMTQHGRMCTFASPPGRFDLKAKHREYKEALRELADSSEKYVVLSKVLLPRASERILRVDGVLAYSPAVVVASCLHSACFSATRFVKESGEGHAGQVVVCVREWAGVGAVQVLAFYHCLATALVEAASVTSGAAPKCHDALSHMSECVELFRNDTPAFTEFELLRQLLLLMVGDMNDGAKSEQENVGVGVKLEGSLDAGRQPSALTLGQKRSRELMESGDDAAACGSWTAVGLRQALQSYVALCKSMHSPTAVPLSAVTLSPTVKTEVTEEEHSAEEIRQCKSHTGMRCDPQWQLVAAAEAHLTALLKDVDAEMLALTGNDLSTRAPAAVGDTTSTLPVYRCHAVCASVFSQVRLLVQVKAAALLKVSCYCLTQLNPARAVHHISALQSFMKVFRRHTEPLLPDMHLVVACLCMSLSLRELEGPHQWPGDVRVDTAEESHTSHDVGLPYWHLAAAERRAAFSPHTHPSAWMRIRLLKALAIYQVSLSGMRLVLSSGVGADSDSDGVAVEVVPLTQRTRCAAALARLMEDLRASSGGSHRAAEGKDGSPTHGGGVAWCATNTVLFRLLQGLIALSEDKDELSAIRAFKSATQLAKRRLGTLDPLTADGLHLLSSALGQFHSGVCDEGLEAAEHARAIAVAFHVAVRTSCTALHGLQASMAASAEPAGSAISLGGRPTDAPSMHLWWRLQVQHLCTSVPLHGVKREAAAQMRGPEDALVGASRSELLAVVGLLPGTPRYDKMTA